MGWRQSNLLFIFLLNKEFKFFKNTMYPRLYPHFTIDTYMGMQHIKGPVAGTFFFRMFEDRLRLLAAVHPSSTGCTEKNQTVVTSLQKFKLGQHFPRMGHLHHHRLKTEHHESQSH